MRAAPVGLAATLVDGLLAALPEAAAAAEPDTPDALADAEEAEAPELPAAPEPVEAAADALAGPEAAALPAGLPAALAAGDAAALTEAGELGTLLAEPPQALSTDATANVRTSGCFMGCGPFNDV